MTTCSECGEECSAKVMDHSFDHDWAGGGTEIIIEVVSSCCEADALEESGHAVTLQDLKDEEEERRAEWQYESARDRALEETWEEERRA